MMRFAGLAVVLLAIPLLAGLLSSEPRARRYAWWALGFGPFVIGIAHLDVSIVPWPYWPGYVKGMIVSLLDSLAIALLITAAGRRRLGPLLPLRLLFLIGSSVSILYSQTRLASFFASWQLARAILLFAAVAVVAAQPRGPRAIIDGMACALILEGLFTVWQRLNGVIQTPGTMGHQNQLGLAIHFALLPCIALMLSGDRRLLPKLGAAGGLIAIALTGSRATVGLAGFGVVLVLLLSLMRKPSLLKWKVAAAGAAALLIAAPVAYLTFSTRFEQAPLASGDYDERAVFEKVAGAIWNDNPMGIGANQYVVVANTRGYSDRAGLAWQFGSRAAHVHNTYLLIAAETGYLGIGSFLLLFAGAIILAVRTAWARPRLPIGELSVGLLATLIVVAMHCLYEWVFVLDTTQYLFAIALGLITGIAQQQRSQAGEARRRRSPAEPVRVIDQAALVREITDVRR